MPKQIVIFGAGGHAKVVIDTIEMIDCYEIAFLVDADPVRIGTTHMGYKVYSEQTGFAAAQTGITHAFVAIGNNESRTRVAYRALESGFVVPTVVNTTAVISDTVTLGIGTIVMPRAVINADAMVGSNVIINTGAIIEHDCRICKNAHIGPGTTLCGGVKVGQDAFIGAGAIILPGVKVGGGSVIAAGAVVLSDVPDHAVAKGVPARLSSRGLVSTKF